MLNKVPEVPCTSGSSRSCARPSARAADSLHGNLGRHLTKTTSSCRRLLVRRAVCQFRCRYVPVVYWLAVVLISVVGTLITENLVDNFGVVLVTTTIVVLRRYSPSTFAVWYAYRADALVHTIYTHRREASTGWRSVHVRPRDRGRRLTAEMLGARLPAVGAAVRRMIGARLRWRTCASRLNAMLALWSAYILTRPLRRLQRRVSG